MTEPPYKKIEQNGPYDAIYLAAHGRMFENEEIFSDLKPGDIMNPLLKHENFGFFMSELLRVIQSSQQELNITLLICFAARTMDITRHHIKEKESTVFLDSFAGKFLEDLNGFTSNRYKIKLVAYTSKIGVNSDGEIEGYTEEKIFKELAAKYLRDAANALAEVVENLSQGPKDIGNAVGFSPRELRKLREESDRYLDRSSRMESEIVPIAGYGKIIFHSMLVS